MRWQSVDSFLKRQLRRHVGKGKIYMSSDKEKRWAKKFVCWYSRSFEMNEFYHTYGTPGIWFHGYLPVKDFGRPEYLYYNERYGYYDFQIKGIEHLEQMLRVMKKINAELNALD